MSKYCSKKCWQKSDAGKRSKELAKKARRQRYKTDSEYRARVIKKSTQRIMRAYHNDPIVRIKLSLRKRVRNFIRTKTIGKSALIGCTNIELRAHLESLWSRGMDWENYGTYWVIDHKLPLASFDLNNLQQRQIACHFTNLQPMTRVKNSEKSDSVTDAQIRLRM